MGRFFTGTALAALCLGVCSGAIAQTAGQNPYIQPQTSVRQLPVNTGATALWETLQKLHTRASLLMIVAHPDDEDSGMLTYEARGMGVRTGMLTLTRGEGGQNVMTADFNDALGLIRTQELLKEDEYSGIDQMWGSVADFGFSKTMDETLANWGYDRVLCDAVRAVRVYRPLVITSVFIGGVTDGHGHHQVAGRLAQEVFNAAGDANVCAEQITKEGLQPWQPLKVYERVPSFSISDKGIYDYATGKYAPAKFYNYITKTWSNETPSTDVVIPEGTYSPLLGMSYLQFARIGLGQQLSQYGGSAFPAAGEADVAYHRYGSKVTAQGEEKSYFDGIDTSLMGIATLAPEDKTLPKELAAIDADVTQAMQQYSITDTAKIAPVLADGVKRVDDLIDGIETSHPYAWKKLQNVEYELQVKRAEFNDALIEALGISMRVQVSSPEVPSGPISRTRENADTPLAVTPGESINVAVQVNNPSSAAVTSPTVIFGSNLKAKYLSDYTCNGSTVFNKLANANLFNRRMCSLGQNQPLVMNFSVTVPSDAPLTRPYFTRPNIEQPYYDMTDTKLNGFLQPPDSVISLLYKGVMIGLGEAVQTAHHVNGQGTVYQPLVVVPAISVAIEPNAGIIPLDAKSVQLRVIVHGNAAVSAGTIRPNLPAGWRAEPESMPFSFTQGGGMIMVPFTVTPKDLAAQSYTISAVVEAGGKTYTEGYTTVGYAGLTPTNLYRPATYKTSGVDVQVAPGLRVAYIPGTGDDVPQSLAALGVNVQLLAMNDLANTNFSQYDEIILGVRAYNAHPELAQIQSRLDSYAKRGGVVVVQYNTAPFASTTEHPLAPYPFVLTFAENVVDEHAAVNLLLPEHPLLNWPNKITAHDFDGWVEERGHSFLRTWDSHYDALTETHDEGQDPQRGGLLVARTGCGAYVYVAYALYRQLPEGVPGAYRLMANLLSLPKNPQAVGCAKGNM